MFTLRKPIAYDTLLQLKPRKASTEVAALIARLRAQAAEGDVELAKLLEELSAYITTEAEPSTI